MQSGPGGSFYSFLACLPSLRGLFRLTPTDPVMYLQVHILILIQKLLEIEKEIVREVAWGDKPYLRKSTDRKAQISPAKLNERLPDLCFAICRFSQVRFITPSHLTHNLFFYSNSFWY